MLFRLLMLGFLILLIWKPAASSPVVLDEDLQHISLADAAELLTYEDQADLDLYDVSALPDVYYEVADFDKDISVQWFRLVLENPGSVSIDYILSLYFYTDYADIYVLDEHDSIVYQAKTGEMIPLDERPFNALTTLYSLVHLRLSPGNYVMYVRTECTRNASRAYRSFHTMYLEEYSLFYELNYSSPVRDGVFFGGIGVLLFFAIGLYLISRDRTYYLTAILIVITGLYTFNEQGYMLASWFSSRPYLNSYASDLLALSTMACHMYVPIWYIRMDKFAPTAAKWLKRILYIQLIGIPLQFFYLPLYEFLLCNTLIACVIVAPGFAAAWKAKYKPTYFYLFAILALIAMLIWYALAHFDLISYQLYAQFFGVLSVIAFQSFFLLMGLMVRFRDTTIEQKQKQLVIEQAVAKSEADRRKLVEKQNVLLEEKIAERTSEIQQKNQQLKEMDEMKSRFFANISHEFRTPLTLIMGPARSIMKAMTDRKIRQELNGIVLNADKMLQLINQLLDLSKSDTRVLKLSTHWLSTSALIGKAIEPFGTEAGGHDVQFSCSQVEDFQVKVDKEKMLRVFDNLLFNAIKFSPPGNAKITIACRYLNGRAIVEIADEGIGIPHNQQEKIFERFYQIDATQAVGSGIGLSLVREYIHLHHGTIRVSDNDPKGSKFTITLPEARLTPDEKKSYIYIENLGLADENTATRPPSSRRKEELPTEILVIEDNLELRAYIKTCLATEGYRVHEANDGADGIEQANERVPDLIISDIMMPRLDGISLVKALKSDWITSHIPIVLLTAKASLEDKVEGLTLGADDYVTKPFVPEELMARVTSLLTNRRKLQLHYQRAIEDKESPSVGSTLDHKFMTHINEVLIENIMDERYDVAKLSETIGMSRTTLYRKLTALTGYSPQTYMTFFRLSTAMDMLKTTQFTVSEIAFKVGFSSVSYFSRAFKKQFSVSPSEYLKSDGLSPINNQ